VVPAFGAGAFMASDFGMSDFGAGAVAAGGADGVAAGASGLPGALCANAAPIIMPLKAVVIMSFLSISTS
jgi:hypothetical protein